MSDLRNQTLTHCEPQLQSGIQCQCETVFILGDWGFTTDMGDCHPRLGVPRAEPIRGVPSRFQSKMMTSTCRGPPCWSAHFGGGWGDMGHWDGEKVRGGRGGNGWGGRRVRGSWKGGGNGGRVGGWRSGRRSLSVTGSTTFKTTAPIFVLRARYRTFPLGWDVLSIRPVNTEMMILPFRNTNRKLGLDSLDSRIVHYPFYFLDTRSLVDR